MSAEHIRGLRALCRSRCAGFVNEVSTPVRRFVAAETEVSPSRRLSPPGVATYRLRTA